VFASVVLLKTSGGSCPTALLTVVTIFEMYLRRADSVSSRFDLYEYEGTYAEWIDIGPEGLSI